MLATLSRTIPLGDYTYEPKWDGFRCLAFVHARDVDLRSRHDRPLARYFPEVVESLLAAANGRNLVLDGEIVLSPDVPFEFSVLMDRLHPAASRVDRLSRETPSAYVAFDLLADGNEDLRGRPFIERRDRLVRVLDGVSGRVRVTPATRDPGVATGWLARFEGGGIDGVVAKPDDVRYAAGRRALVKVKRQRTADCVVAGIRLMDVPAVRSLLLGLHDPVGRLRHVGVVTQLPRGERVALITELGPLAIPLEEHPWRDGFEIGGSPLGRLKGSAARWMPDMDLDWVPLRPERVAEVGFDQVDGDRFRHPARLLRWRPDREASSCTLDQIETTGSDRSAIFAASASSVVPSMGHRP